MILSAREIAPFELGHNDTDVIINGVHFNRTALGAFNYTLYSNGTLSNGSHCWLAFDIFQPRMDLNGTFLNATSCYTPIIDLQDHGKVGIAFAAMFAVSILFTLLNLRKHGKTFLPPEKRWKAVSRRWVWYWLLVVAVCGVISGFMSVDVDRDYLQSLPLILQSLFYYLMLPSVMAAVWEGVRHWGSWQERQIFDRNPALLPAETTREAQEFWVPLVFYTFAWINFFLAIPRSWTPIELQRSPEQQDAHAKPTATDARFKAAGFMALGGWLVICYSLAHSLYRYRRPPAGFRCGLFYLCAAPAKFKLVIGILAVKIAYAIASAFEWSISPFKYNANSGWIYGLGYTPALLIIIIFNIFGHEEPNEDQALMAQREERSRLQDMQLELESQQPSWWRKMRSSGRLKAFAAEMGMSRPQRNDLEMSDMGPRYTDEDRKDGKEMEVTAIGSGASSTVGISSNSGQASTSSTQK
ncbi:hypothetical protein T310_2549 [Rasamsonia emersonii CBS 393.64]|uniref:Uncharacterized protein n=1 Tax=Rasamsonia emersonii (strain ATCC 16479 / CBS 393.64 / IMI 116815) TaxID=1408163 RepID=A0A0F4Z0T0_RASE3|nr:hypothetical protein T310_2549 [Rasamsonia emersonii CBS 393.64]KKA23483.1 hypothetical protein T310_2549 [Rasamsonia emersonii CBS 393.64]